MSMKRASMKHVDEACFARELRSHDLHRVQLFVAERDSRAIDFGHSAAGNQPQQVILSERHRIIRRTRRQLPFL
jgi:hypothetical protein